MAMHTLFAPLQARRSLPRRVAAVAAFSLLSLLVMTACHRRPPVVLPVERLAAQDAPVALWVPEIGLAGQKTDAYFTSLTRRAGGQALARLRQNLTTQLGFDPSSPDAIRKVGLHPQGGAMLWKEPGAGALLLALPCADKEALDRTLTQWINRRDAAQDVSRSSHLGQDIITVSRPFGQSSVPSAHWAHVAGYAVLTQGEGLQALKAWLERRHTLDAKTSPGAAAAHLDIAGAAALPQGIAYLGLRAPPRNAPVVAKLGPQPQAPNSADQASPALWGSLRLDGEGLAADVRISQGQALHSRLSAALSGAPVGPLAGLVADEAWALAPLPQVRVEDTGDDLPKIFEALEQEGLRSAASKLVIALHKTLAPHCQGPAALSLHLQPETTLGQVLGEMQRPRALLGHFLQASATAPLQDAPAAAKALAALPKVLANQNIVITSRSTRMAGETLQIYSTQSFGTPIDWTICNKHVVWSAGQGRLERSIETLVHGPSALGEAKDGSVMRQWHVAPGAVFALRCAAMAHSIETMAHSPAAGQSTAAAAGIGAIVASVADVLRTVGDIAIGVSTDAAAPSAPPSPSSTALQVTVRQQFQ